MSIEYKPLKVSHYPAVFCGHTLRYLMNGGSKETGRSEIFVKFNKRGGQNKGGMGGVGRNFKKSVNIGNK